MTHLRIAAVRRLMMPVLMLAVCGSGPGMMGQSAEATKPAPRPVFKPTPEQLAMQAAAEKEHQREMDLLGIKTIRPGADGNRNSPRAANYDESKADVYPNLPDPLLLKNGKRVTTAQEWWTERRPQIVELFDRDIYGRVPAHLPGVTWEVVSVKREMNGNVPVKTKTLVGHVDNSSDPKITVNIELTVSTPANAKGPVPVIMELGLSKAVMAMLMKRFPQFAKLGPKGPTWEQRVLARGWGYAEYIPTSVQADSGGGLTSGIIGLANKGRPRKLDDWGALRAWAWGASRALDYFETDKDVDAKQVGIEGHSRYGKASLVAMAYDKRFAIGYISSSGEAGAKLYRHIFGEQIGNIAGTQEFHWMAGNFMRYDGPLNAGDLPVDNHELIALCAPRPVFISGGATDGDGWVDAKGMFLAAAGVGPVYRLLGKKDMGTTVFPPMGTSLIDGAIAFRQHSGGHTPVPNWPTFIKFASRYLHAPGEPAASTDVAHLTAKQDRARTAALLGIEESQLSAPLSGDAKAPNSTNYDEAKANKFTNVPDPLMLNEGARITTAAEWWQERRPEIRTTFDQELLGITPVDLPAVKWEVTGTRQEMIGGVHAVVKTLVGHVDNSRYPRIKVNIDLKLATPAKAAGPVPVLMELAFAGDYPVALDPPPPGGRPMQAGKWDVQAAPVLQRGWGFAVLLPTSFQADDGAGLTEGIIGLMNKGQPRDPTDWGALKAWAWGASRALDYFETDKAVDAKQVGILGHSRFGKTALVAMAYDPRFAIAYVSSSGEGGAKLYRHDFGEPIPNLASTTEYHWMA
ncbi:MAG TPA: hypothetical protein VFI20_10570, partial [Terracidiphilus sp.]|nr:hypothetical protein [Terracidiphilus sp.]